jgi:hypothetical protein
MDNSNKNTEKPSCLVGYGADWWRTACTGSRILSAAPCTWPAAAGRSAGLSPPCHRVKTKIHTHPVLRIRDVYPGSDFFPSRIPDLNCLYPGSRTRIKEFKYFNPKKWFLSSRKYDPGCSSRIRMLTFYPSRIPDPGVKKEPDPGSRSATLYTSSQMFLPLFF